MLAVIKFTHIIKVSIFSVSLCIGKHTICYGNICALDFTCNLTQSAYFPEVGLLSPTFKSCQLNLPLSN